MKTSSCRIPVRSSSGRALNVEYKENRSGMRQTVIYKIHASLPIRNVYTIWKAFRYIKKVSACLSKRKTEVPVLDATAITVSILRRDCLTAGSVMFLLGLGEILEEWTHKKSVGDLARSMSLNVGKSVDKDPGSGNPCGFCICRTGRSYRDPCRQRHSV